MTYLAGNRLELCSGHEDPINTSNSSKYLSCSFLCLVHLFAVAVLPSVSSNSYYAQHVPVKYKPPSLKQNLANLPVAFIIRISTPDSHPFCLVLHIVDEFHQLWQTSTSIVTVSSASAMTPIALSLTPGHGSRSSTEWWGTKIWVVLGCHVVGSCDERGPRPRLKERRTWETKRRKCVETCCDTKDGPEKGERRNTE